MKTIAILFAFFAAFFVVTDDASAWQKEKMYHKENNGIKYVFVRGRTNGGRVNIHCLKINPDQCQIKLKMAYDRIGRLASLRRITSSEKNILAATNGTFFVMGSGLPISTIMIDGEMVFIGTLNRSTCGICGITENNEIFFGIPKIRGLLTIYGPRTKKYIFWKLNRPRSTQDITIYTPAYGPKTSTSSAGIEITVIENQVTAITKGKGNTSIPVNGFIISLYGKAKKVAQNITLGTRIELSYTLDDRWKRAKQIFTGGPRLLKDGKVIVSQTIREERFSGYLLGRNPRTAIGVTKDGNIILVVADGRQRSSVGVTFYELAHIMSDLGAVEAMALDGGNSSMMYLDGKIINSPSNGGRAIPNAIIVVPKNNHQ